MVSKEENISLFIEENYKYNNNTNINELISNFNKLPLKKIRTNSFDDNLINYEENTVKELNLICEYYEINVNRLKKNEIIDIINFFEYKLENEYIVRQRKRLWFYIETLKNDKFMKKYVLW